MDPFTPDELQAVDRLWKSLPAGHVWTGWAAAGDAPREVWIIRTRAHWRRFPLRKLGSRYALYDETGQTVAIAETLAALLDRVENLPGFKGIAGDGQTPSD